ncbi:MAG: hypothetical protein ACKVZJ_01895 [Phycisphaerales bacterium]
MTDPENQLVELTTRPNELDAGLLCEVLRSGGVECVTRQANSAALGIFGASSFNPIAVMVRAGDFITAQRLLENRRSESVDIDWNEVDVGEPADDIARDIAQREADGKAGVSTRTRSNVALVAAAAVLVVTIGFLAGPLAMLIGVAVIAVVYAIKTLRGGTGPGGTGPGGTGL